MPKLVATLGGDRAIDAGRVSCNFEEDDAAIWFRKTIQCPMKFGVQGLDALRAAPVLMSLIPDYLNVDSPLGLAPAPDKVNVDSKNTVGTDGTGQDGFDIQNPPQCTYNEAVTCPAGELLWNPQVHQVTTDILMRAGSGLFNIADREIVEDMVSKGFQNISIDIQKRTPEVAL